MYLSLTHKQKSTQSKNTGFPCFIPVSLFVLAKQACFFLQFTLTLITHVLTRLQASTCMYTKSLISLPMNSDQLFSIYDLLTWNVSNIPYPICLWQAFSLAFTVINPSCPLQLTSESFLLLWFAAGECVWAADHKLSWQDLIDTKEKPLGVCISVYERVSGEVMIVKPYILAQMLLLLNI